MVRIRLSPFVSVIPLASRVLFRGDLKSFALSGTRVTEIVRRVLPLLDGRHDADAIVRSLPGYGRKTIRALLADLQQAGVVEAVGPRAAPPATAQQEELSAFLNFWKRANREAPSGLARAHVAIIGSNGWSTVACEELVRSGVGRLTVLDVPGNVRPGMEAPGRLLRRLRRLGSPTAVSHRLVMVEDGVLEWPFGDVALLLVTANADELPLLAAVARMAEKRRVRHLIAHVEGLSATLGPVVVPGETACWECLRTRRLANQPNFGESALLQASLLAGEGAARRSLSPPGAAAILGGLILSETVKLVSGFASSRLVGRQVELDLVSYAARTHDLIRLPWCPVCGGAARVSAHGKRGGGGQAPKAGGRDLASLREPADLRKNLAGWVDDRTGIIQHLSLDDASPDEPHALSTATAVIAGPVVGRVSPGSSPLVGAGKGTTRCAALVGAAGEAVERYSASLYREEDLLRASPRKLGRRGFDPVSLCLYRPEQYARRGFPYDRFDPSREISWARATWLDSGKPVLVPALATYFNYRAPRGEQFCQVTSNGLAAGPDSEDAALRAALELIERDAFMMTWLQRRPPRLITAAEELGADVLELMSELRDLGMDTKLYLMRSDVGIPAVLCVAWGDGRVRPAANVALAAHPDPVEAARKAIFEQAHVGPYLAGLMAGAKRRMPRTADDVRRPEDHALFYAPRTALRAFDFIRFTRRRKIALSALKRPSGSATGACLEALDRGGFRIAIADVTSPDVRLGPFRVARALGTYLQPLDFGHRERRLANPRLGKAAHTLNPNPHPLA